MNKNRKTSRPSPRVRAVPFHVALWSLLNGAVAQKHHLWSDEPWRPRRPAHA